MQRAGTGRKLTVWAVEAPAGEVDDEPAPSPSTDLAGSGAAPPAPEASAVPASPAILARVARGMMLFGVAVALFIGYEFPLSALYQQQNQSSLLGAFKEQLPTGNLDKASALLPEASPVALLRISRLHLQQIVV
ncbi:MAG: hypothetical protein J2P28_16845, partial [Actinobacteria bacterium]|nr:hypothetical protein [Actinomycetota bacterium]